MRIFTIISVNFIVLYTLFSLQPASAAVTADPMGFAIFIEEGEEVAGDLILTNDGEEDIGYSFIYRKIRREEDQNRGPQRDDPGDVIQEINLDYNYCLGLSFDPENSVMWAVHSTSNRLVGYEWNGEEITETIADFNGGNQPVGLGYYDGVLYTSPWQSGTVTRFNVDGVDLGNVDSGLQGIMGLAIDPEQGHLYLLDFPSCNVLVLDIEDDFEQIGMIENILDGADFQDMRSRINWVPEHDDGHLWVSWRPDPNDEPSFAWQVAIDEDWNWEEVQSFHVETDNRSFGIGHDGSNMWVATASIDNADITTLRIIDDGIIERGFIMFDEEEGVIPAGEELDLEYIINPDEFEQGVHEIVMSIRFDDPEIETIMMTIIMSLDMRTTSA
jgi:hypothetical protein